MTSSPSLLTLETLDLHSSQPMPPLQQHNNYTVRTDIFLSSPMLIEGRTRAGTRTNTSPGIRTRTRNAVSAGECDVAFTVWYLILSSYHLAAWGPHTALLPKAIRINRARYITKSYYISYTGISSPSKIFYE